MKNLKLLFSYIRYKLFATTEHSIHSPFIFDFITNVLNDDNNYYAYNSIEDIRKRMLNDLTTINFQDFGAGSKKFQTNQRPIHTIVKYGISKKKFAELYFRIINRYNLRTGIELGTSLGLTACYLGKANSKFELFTIEGCSDLANYSRNIFNELNLKNIHSIHGTFDDELPKLIQQIPSLDFFFIDGNHRYDSTIRYFQLGLEKINENSIFIFDDIRWSEEMVRAWEDIKSHEKVKASIDLFYVGIVFFNSCFREKEDFIIKF